MRARKTGVVLLVIGIMMVIYTGFTFVTRDKVLDVGPLEIRKEEKHPVYWSPVVGLVLLAGGIGMITFSKHRS